MTNNTDICRKTFEWKAMASESGGITGNANGLGIMDRSGDVVAPGAFKKCVAEFVEKGFMAVGHDWAALPVGYWQSAKEEDGFLKVAGEFHSDEVAQRARTVVMERLDHNKFVGLSIGFLPDRDQCSWHETGKAMWTHLQRNGLDGGMDGASIKGWKGSCRLIGGVKDLYEVSIVTVPVNQISSVTDVKSLACIQEEGAPAALSFGDHQDTVLAAVDGFANRALALKELKARDGRELSQIRRDQFRELGERLLSLSEIEVPVDLARVARLDSLRNQAALIALTAGAI